MRRRQHDAQAERRGDDAPPHVRWRACCASLGDGADGERRRHVPAEADPANLIGRTMTRRSGTTLAGVRTRAELAVLRPSRYLSNVSSELVVRSWPRNCPGHRTTRVRHSPWTNMRSRSRENTNGCLPERVIVLPFPHGCTPRPHARSRPPRGPAHHPPAAGARVHRLRGPPARLPAERAGDRRGGRPVLAVHRPRAPRRAPGQGLPRAATRASPARSR